ncbi:oligosaccharide flippase family protein [Tenacibaculum sp. 47A_GOM-205m]|uniref:oligosaccharide flippase family protein n=1 Tax=Tenacibaculum sp. 47A_GOM-205m TaxID=1380384 RepID=UPI00048BCC18|nr:oligosaccharide flippase family protein [Tenacibaculum sp. 47A_GOM-205m]
MSQLKKGAILSYVTIVLTNIVGLVLTPFIIEKLGDAEYGLYTLIGAFVGYISVLDFGLNNTIVRFVAKYRAEKDKRAEENFLGTTMLIYGIISLVVLFFGVLLYFNLDSIFSSSLTNTELEKAKVMFVILIFNLAITLPGGAFAAICSGYEHFVFPRAVNIGRYIFRSLMVVGLLMYGGDAVGLVILDTIMNILVISLNSFYVFKKLKVKFKFFQTELVLVKEIFSYSIWIFVFAVVQMFQWRSGQVILGVVTDTTTVAIYAIGIMLGTYYGAFASAINSVVLPKATKMVVNSETGESITNMMVKIGKPILLVLGLVLINFSLFGKKFIYLWVGDTYKEAWFIAVMIMLLMTVPLTQGFGNSILEADNKIRGKALLNLITMALGVLVGYFLAKDIGMNGMLYGILLGLFVNMIITNIYYVHFFNFKVIYFFKKLYAKFVFILLISLILGLMLNYVFKDITWMYFFVKVTLLSITYVYIVYLVFLNVEERKNVKKRLFK